MSDNRFTLSDAAGAIVLEFDGSVIVGRAPAIEHQGTTYDLVLQLEQSTVSSNHASLTPTPEGLLVSDLGSTNGTFIDHQRLTGPTVAQNGSEIRFDTHTLTLSDAHAQGDDATVESVSPAADATVIRSNSEPPVTAAEPDDSDLANAAMGKTMMMEVNKNLPRSWQNDSPGTIILKPGEANEQLAIDADALAAQFDEPTLVLLGDSGEGQPISLRSDGDLNFWNIGRDAKKHELSIVLDDPSVSDFHAKLVRRGEKWSILDQISTNKTRVNGEIVLKRFLSSKDVIEFGATKALLILPQGQRTPSPGVGSSAGMATDKNNTVRWLIIAAVIAVLAGGLWFLAGAAI